MKANQEMTIFKKTKDLIEYTFCMTDNTKKFPKKTRFTFVNRMQNLTLDIYSKLLKANETRNRNKRKDLQSDVLSDIKILLFLIELSLHKNYINDKQCVIWTKRAKDVKYLTAAWYNKT